MLNSNTPLRRKLCNLEGLAFSCICYSTVNAVNFNVISKADERVYALQESLKKMVSVLTPLTSMMFQECRIPLGNLNFAFIRIYGIGIS